MYFVADYFLKCLTEGNKTKQPVQNFILKVIFMEKDYRVIRIFIDGLLLRTNPSVEVLKQYGKRTHELWKNGVTILYQ